MGVINCCRGCVAPKRHKACWGSCPEYLAEKAEYDRLKGEYDKKERIVGAIMGDNREKMYRALKHRRNKRK